MEGFDQPWFVEAQQQKLARNFLAMSVLRNGTTADGINNLRSHILNKIKWCLFYNFYLCAQVPKSQPESQILHQSLCWCGLKIKCPN